METARITLKGDNIRLIAKQLDHKEDIYYKYETRDVVILFDEEYYGRIESNLMIVYILNFKDEQTVEIEMVSGGGSSNSVFNWGAETSEIRKVTLDIIALCKENSWEIVDVYPEEFKKSLEKTTAQRLKDSVLSWFKPIE